MGRTLNRNERTVLNTSQERLDEMTDDEKWTWLGDVVAAEHALANQLILEGHPE